MNVDPRGPRFGAAITTAVLAIVLVIAGIGCLGFAAGSTTAGMIFTVLALAAAFLNAAFDLCLGCQMYLLIQRIRPAARGVSHKPREGVSTT